MGKHPLFSWGLFSFTAIVTLRVGQPWGSFGFTVSVTVRVGQPWGLFDFIKGQIDPFRRCEGLAVD